jgi:hypothetical protein
MAHFARITDGQVARQDDIHVVNNAVITDGNGVEQETLGQALLADLWGGDPADYVQCSYNATMRGCYPAAGYGWDGTNFIPPDALSE